MTAPALRPLSVGEILDVSFTLYRRHFAALATVALVCSGVPVLMSVYLEAAGGLVANFGFALLYYMVFMVLSAIATAATVFIVSESYLGRPLGAREALVRSTPLLGRILICSIQLAIVIGLGFLFFFIPGVVLACGLMVALPALVLEPGLSPSGSLGRSWGLTRGARLRMLGLLVTLVVLLYIPMFSIVGLAAIVLPAAGGSRAVGTLAAAALGGVIQMFLYPLFYCVLTVAYYDLRVRKEGFDLEVLASTLQPA